MRKNILVISTSLREKSNSELLAQYFVNGATEANHEVTFISLKDKHISFCRGCLACQKTQKCVIQDDANEIVEMMKNADVIVFSTPIYYYEMSGQMKTLLDRANPLYTADYRFKDIYLLTVAAEDDPSTPNRAKEGLQGWIDCFDGVSLKYCVFAGGVNNPNSIQNHIALVQAYQMGKEI